MWRSEQTRQLKRGQPPTWMICLPRCWSRLDVRLCWIISHTDLFVKRFFLNGGGVVLFPINGYYFLPIGGQCMDAVLLYVPNKSHNASAQCILIIKWREPKETRYPVPSYFHLSPKLRKPKCNPGNRSLKAKGLKEAIKIYFLVRTQDKNYEEFGLILR